MAEVKHQEHALSLLESISSYPTNAGLEIVATALASAYQRGLDAAKPAWIACEERMPEPGVPVLVFAYGRIVPHLDAVGFVTRSFMGLANHVTHWMPLSALPDPPSAGKGGQHG
jgi:hypothetical protein